MALSAEDVVGLAKARLLSLFADEGVRDLHLEELVREPEGGWSVTFSFFRPSKFLMSDAGALAKVIPPEWQREEKVVELSPEGEVIAVLSA